MLGLPKQEIARQEMIAVLVLSGHSSLLESDEDQDMVAKPRDTLIPVRSPPWEVQSVGNLSPIENLIQSYRERFGHLERVTGSYRSSIF